MIDRDLAESIVRKIVASDRGGHFIGSGPTSGVIDVRIDLTEDEEIYIDRLKDELL